MNSKNIQDDQFSIKNEFEKYYSHWKWFLLSIFSFLILALIYLKFVNPIFKSTITVLIKDSTEGRGLSELAAFEDIGVNAGNNDIDDEIDIIKSKTLITKVIKELNLNVIQFSKDGLRNKDLYKYSPVEINFDWNNNIPEDQHVDLCGFKIEIESKDTFLLHNLIDDTVKSYKYGSEIHLSEGNLIINKSKLFNVNLKLEQQIREIELIVVPINVYIEIMQDKIIAQKKGDRSSIIDISIKLSNKYKARDVLNRLVKLYNQEAIDDKNILSKNTVNFITERLRIISEELDSVESKKAIFKKGNKITNIKAESEIFVGNISDSEKKILTIETQIDLTNSMIEYLSKPNKDSDILPPNIGLSNPSINELINQYNQLVLGRDRLLSSSTQLNPLVVDLNSEIINLKGNLLQALITQKNNFLITKRDYNNEKLKINSKIRSIPAIEKDFRGIERQQQIKESLYLFLLKKREETSISMSVTSPVAKVIDNAYTSVNPISPRKKIILLIAFLLGAFVPFGVIYLKDTLDNKIHSKSDVELVVEGIPVLSELPRIKRNQRDVIGRNDRSSLGESFRILTTNLDYFSKGKHIDGRALNVFVTSTIKGEGKTFVSYNLCLSLAEAGNKILIIGADIRNPQLHRFEQPEVKKAKGLAEFLYDDSVTIDEVITNVNHNGTNVDVVFSGRIPPNPTELLNNGRLQELVESVGAEYDIIIVDTAPTMLVTDTLLISKIADITLYVTRAGFTDTRLLQYPMQLKEENKLNGLAFVINDVKENNLGYGTKYGYGYGEEVETKWHKKIFKKS